MHIGREETLQDRSPLDLLRPLRLRIQEHLKMGRQFAKQQGRALPI